MRIPIYKPFLPKNSLDYAHDALNSTWLSSQGKYISLVQEKLQELLKVKYILPVNNGTSACHLLAKSIAFKYNKYEVIVPNNVYVAAWNAFLFDGNYDLYSVETDINTWNYDLKELDKTITQHPDAAVLIVHNIGNIINVPELQRKYPNTIFVEDNCEGLFGKYENKYSGTESFSSSISFFGNKHITSGEGGAFLTNDEETYQFVKCTHAQGQSDTKFVHCQLGYNYRMTNIQAAILAGQLEVLPTILELKQNIFNIYRNHIKDRENIFPQTIASGTEHSNWMFGVRISGKESYQATELYFKNKGIEIRPMFYSIDTHTHLNNHYNVVISNCDNAKLLNRECFILPSYPDLTKEEHKYILQTLDDYLRNR